MRSVVAPLLGPLLLVTLFFGGTLMTAGDAAGQEGVTLSVRIAPPALPVYDQPPMPDLGYIWTPGYWSWNQEVGYYWVPGTWVQPPAVGVLWTPPYWGWSDGAYQFHPGYWGEHVGYYGGINYGFGYGGTGYHGGRWQDGHLVYNRNGNNFGAVRGGAFFQERLAAGNRDRSGFAGGAGGQRTQPNEAQRAVERETHLPVTADQARHSEAAAVHPGLAASHDKGRPAIAATSRPAQFEGPGVVPPRAPAEHSAPRARPESGSREQERPRS